MITKSYLISFCILLIFLQMISFQFEGQCRFSCALDNFCENALDLTNGKLIIAKSLMPIRTHCHWMISAEDDKHINLEFQNIDVRIAK